MKHKTTLMTALAALALVGSASAATTIEYSYYTGTSSNDASWVIPSGYESIKAVNFGQTSGTTAFGGVNWLPVTTPESTNNDGPIDMEYLYSGGGHYNAYYANDTSGILTFGDYGLASNTISLSGFTVGQEYLVQFVLADTRNDSGIPGRTITIEGTSANISGQNSTAYTFAYTTGEFGVVTAKFTPSVGDTAFTFTPNMGSGTQINAIQVLVPEPSAALLGALGLLGLLRRRR